MTGCEWLDSVEKLCSVYLAHNSAGPHTALDTATLISALRSAAEKVKEEVNEIESSAKKVEHNGVEYLVFITDEGTVESNPVLRGLWDAGACVKKDGKCVFVLPRRLVEELKNRIGSTVSNVTNVVDEALERFREGFEAGRKQAEKFKKILEATRRVCAILPSVERYLREANCDIREAVKRIGEECARGRDKIDSSVVACARPKVDAIWEMMRLMVEVCRARGGDCEEPPKAMYDALVAATMTAALRTVAGEAWEKAMKDITSNPLLAFAGILEPNVLNAIGQSILYGAAAFTEPFQPVAMELVKGNIVEAWNYVTWAAEKVWGGILDFLGKLVRLDWKGVAQDVSSFLSQMGEMASDPDFWTGFVFGLALSLGVGVAVDAVSNAISELAERVAARVAVREAGEAIEEAVTKSLLRRVIGSVLSRALRLASRLSEFDVEELLSQLAYSIARKLASKYSSTVSRQVVEELLSKTLGWGLKTVYKLGKGYVELGIELGTGGLYPGPIARLTGRALSLALRAIATGLARLRGLVAKGNIEEALDLARSLSERAAPLDPSLRARLERISSLLESLEEMIDSIADVEHLDDKRVDGIIAALNSLKSMLGVTDEQLSGLYSRIESRVSDALSRLAEEANSIAATGDNIQLARTRLADLLEKANALAKLIEWLAGRGGSSKPRRRLSDIIDRSFDELLGKLEGLLRRAGSEAELKDLLKYTKSLYYLVDNASGFYPDLEALLGDRLDSIRERLAGLEARIEERLRALNSLEDALRRVADDAADVRMRLGGLVAGSGGIDAGWLAERLEGVVSELERVLELVSMLGEAGGGQKLGDALAALTSMLRSIRDAVREHGVAGDVERLKSILERLDSILSKLEENTGEHTRYTSEARKTIEEMLDRLSGAGAGSRHGGEHTRLTGLAGEEGGGERPQTSDMGEDRGEQVTIQELVERVKEREEEGRAEQSEAEERSGGKNVQVVLVRESEERTPTKLGEIEPGLERGGGETPKDTKDEGNNGGNKPSVTPKNDNQPKPPSPQPQPPKPAPTPTETEDTFTTPTSTDSDVRVFGLSLEEPRSVVHEGYSTTAAVEYGVAQSGSVAMVPEENRVSVDKASIMESRVGTTMLETGVATRGVSSGVSTRVVSTTPSKASVVHGSAAQTPEGIQAIGASTATTVIGVALSTGLYGAQKRLIGRVSSAYRRRRRWRRKQDESSEYWGSGMLGAGSVRPVRLMREEWMPW